MEASRSAKRNSKVLVAALWVNLVVIGGLMVYFTYVNAPRHFSQLAPEAGKATACNITSPDLPGNIFLTDGELEEFFDYLERFQYYPIPGSSGKNIMEGNWFYHISLRVNDAWSTQTLTLSDTGKLLIGPQQYETRDNDFDLSSVLPVGWIKDE